MKSYNLDEWLIATHAVLKRSGVADRVTLEIVQEMDKTREATKTGMTDQSSTEVVK